MFREKVKSMLEAFLRELATLQEDFTRLQPITKDGVSSTTALAFVAKWKGLVGSARQQVRWLLMSRQTGHQRRQLVLTCLGNTGAMHVSTRRQHAVGADSCPATSSCLSAALNRHFVQAGEIQSGMDIFNITQPPYKELAHLEHELELLSKMWGVVAEWETTYGGWKNGHFKELKVS